MHQGIQRWGELEREEKNMDGIKHSTKHTSGNGIKSIKLLESQSEK